MKKLIIGLSVLVFAAVDAQAFELGLIAGYESNGVTTDSATTSYASGSATGFGGLFLFSLFPFIQARTGIISKTRKIKGTTAGIDTTTQDTLLEIPANIEVNFPLGLYVFGGVIFSNTQNTTCTSSVGVCTVTSKTPSDTPINLGIGFNVVDMMFFKFGIEGEYEMGNKSIDTVGGSSSKVHSMGINAVAKFGF